MAGIKGMKGSGGVREGGGRKPIPLEYKKTERLAFRCTKEEKELLEKLKGDLSLAEFILKCIKEREDGLLSR